MSQYLLPVILGTPLVGALVLMLVPRSEAAIHRGIGIAIALLTFCVSLGLLAGFDFERGDYQMVVDIAWIPGLNAHFHVGIDGISLWLVLLTTFLTPLVLLSATKAITHKVREFVIAMLVLEVGVLGAFLALDLFLFYVMWEVMLIPMYLLIGIWGGEDRQLASIKFFLYTMLGSMLMLVAIFYVYVTYGRLTGTYTFDLTQLELLMLPRSTQLWCFLAFALAFAIKVPLFPLHTWLPDAHTEAPTAGSVILAGVLLKLGIYGLIRFAMPLFPHGAAQAAPYIGALAVIGIVYGALVAFAQTDVKKLIAYSSVSHLGFCALGLVALNSTAIEGSIFAMLSHGLTTGGLFLAIGVLYERRHTRRLSEFGGLWRVMPVFGAMFLIVTLGSAGLPGLSGFVGEFLTLFGTFTAKPTIIGQPMLLAAIAATGVILGAVYLLYMFQKVMFGPVTRPVNETLPDLSRREVAVFVPIVALIFFMGVMPRPFLRSMEPSVDRFVQSYHNKLQAPDGPPRVLAAGAALTGAPTEAERDVQPAAGADGGDR